MGAMQGEPRRRDDTVSHHRQAVARVIESMQGRLDEELPLTKMAEVAYMSPFHLNRVFREVTGVPPRRFLTARRLERAKRLLLTTDLPVTEIALEVGYNSLGTFTRRFGELVGVAPGGFRVAAETAVSTLRNVSPASFTPHGAVGDGLEGRISAPPGFTGQIFVGLFAGDLPQSRPVACALLGRPGNFRLGPVPDGTYRLFAAGLAAPSAASGDTESLLYETALRGGSERPVAVARGTVARGTVARGTGARGTGARGTGAAAEATAEEIAEGGGDPPERGPLDVGLRAPELFDPPILMTFPVLLAARRHRRLVAPPPWAEGPQNH